MFYERITAEDVNKIIQIGEDIGGVNTDDISDGSHTFKELYHHRCILFSIICNQNKNISWKSKKHIDGTMYNNMFIVGLDTPKGPATYHYDMKYWDLFKVKEIPHSPEYDGYTPDEALERFQSIVE